ncbi:MAG: iron ABC transporter permease [Rhodospirillales bacterium]
MRVTPESEKMERLPLSQRLRRLSADGWTIGAILIAGLVALPVAAVIWLAFAPSDDIWDHLAATVLPYYAQTTVILMLGVGLGTFVIGTGTAWLVTMCRFPGRRVFEWAMLLPLAVPTYVLAYVYTDVLEYAGPVQEALRLMFGWQTSRDYWFPEIRSLGGAIAMMTLVLYPYVYLLSRAAFLEQSVCVLEVSRTLGKNPWRGFLSVALPLARPAIVVGVTLVLMETLNDFGTVDFFAVATFTAGIYDVWLNQNSVSGAAQLAGVLLLFVLVLITVERYARRKQRFHHTSSKYSTMPSYPLSGGRAILAFLSCFLPVALGFLLPGAVLFRYAVQYFEEALTGDFWLYAANSLILSTVTAAVAVIIGMFMAYGVRLGRGPLVSGAARFASMGYAVPGAVLAIGVIIPMAALDNALDSFSREVFGVSLGLLLSGTVFAVIYGYLARFTALSFGTLDSSLAKITPSMDGAARTLGSGPAAVLRRIHLPMIRGSILTAALLVFVDCMKELPMTLILRPFNFDTLATYVHQFASDELLEESALGALAIVAAGILPVILLSLTIARSRPGQVSAGPAADNVPEVVAP